MSKILSKPYILKTGIRTIIHSRPFRNGIVSTTHQTRIPTTSSEPRATVPPRTTHQRTHPPSPTLPPPAPLIYALFPIHPKVRMTSPSTAQSLQYPHPKPGVSQHFHAVEEEHELFHHSINATKATCMRLKQATSVLAAWLAGVETPEDIVNTENMRRGKVRILRSWRVLWLRGGCGERCGH